MSRVAKVESFILTVARDEPYLGALRIGEEANDKGYFVRKGNKTVYLDRDRTVLVRVETDSGAVGWGETYGLAAPRATTEIITDLLVDFIVGRDPAEAAGIHDDLYDLMRVRGYTGGFYLDALAAVDIALWDVSAREAGKSLAEQLGGCLRKTLPCYVSGLPKPTLEERVEYAKGWQLKGFNTFKIGGRWKRGRGFRASSSIGTGCPDRLRSALGIYGGRSHRRNRGHGRARIVVCRGSGSA